MSCLLRVTYSPCARRTYPSSAGYEPNLSRSRRSRLPLAFPASMRRAFALSRAALILLAGCGGGGGSGDHAVAARSRREQGTPVLGQRGDEEPAGPGARLPGLRDQEHDARGRRRPGRRRRRRRAGGVSRRARRTRGRDGGRARRPGRLARRHRGRAARRAAAARARAAHRGRRAARGDRRRARQARADRGQAGAAARRSSGSATWPRPTGSRRPTSPAATRRRSRARSTAARRPRPASRRSAVLVASADRPEFAMPAAGWAAKSGDPVLWTARDTLPADDRSGDQGARQAADLRARAGRRGLRRGCSSELRKLGSVTAGLRRGPGHERDRVRALHATGASAGASSTPATASCSRRPRRALDAAAAAPLSASGTYGPLLLVTEASALPARRCRTTCSTSSPATTRTRCAAFTITAG